MAFDKAFFYITAIDNKGQMAGKYKRLTFFYSEVPGAVDKDGSAIGPIRAASITARGYWGDFPSKLDLEGILDSLGFDMRGFDVFTPRKVLHSEYDTRYGKQSRDTYIYEQPTIALPASRF